MSQLIRLLLNLRRVDVFCAMVYLQEAHADDLWPLGYGRQSHSCIEDRLRALETFLGENPRLEEALQAVAVDTIDDNFLHCYGAWPERYFLADLSGQVSWASDPVLEATSTNSAKVYEEIWSIVRPKSQRRSSHVVSGRSDLH